MMAEWHRVDIEGVKPTARCSHTATLVSDGEIIVMIGGGVSRDGVWSHLDDVWRLHFAQLKWTRLQVQEDWPLLGRRGHSTVDDASRRRLIVFGGACDQGFHEGEAALRALGYDGRCSRMRTTGQQPHGRRGHACAVVGDRMVLYGGDSTEADVAHAANVHVLDLSTDAWSLVRLWDGAGPAEVSTLLRSNFTGVSLASCGVARERLWICGGTSLLGAPGGAYSVQLGGHAAQWAVAESPSRTWTSRYAAASCVLGDRYLVLVGGTKTLKARDLDDALAYSSDVRVLDVDATLKNNGMAVWLDLKHHGTTLLPRNAATATAVTALTGDEVVVVFGGGVYDRQYFDDLHVLRLKETRASAPRLSSLQSLCEASVGPIDADCVFSLLVFAHDRAAPLLKLRCLTWIQDNLGVFAPPRHYRPKEQPHLLPDWSAVAARPDLHAEVTRALRGI